MDGPHTIIYMEVLQKKDGFKDEHIIVVPADFMPVCTRNPLIRNIYVTDAGVFPYAKNHYRERPLGAEENILIYCMEGTGYIETAHKKITLTRHTAFCIPAHQPHIYYSDRTDIWSILWVHFKGLHADLYSLSQKQKVTISTPESSEQVKSDFFRMMELLENDFSEENFVCISGLLVCFLNDIFFHKNNTKPDVQSKLLTRAIQYMYSNISHPVTIEDLASYMNISKSYVSRIFRKHTQRSPIDFLTHLRIQQACRDLRMTSLKIYEVALRAGYEDQFYFSRLFHKITGVSPRDWQKGKEQ